MTSLAELPPETAVARAATVALAYRISVDQFEAMERHDIFAPDDKLELIHGLITRKAPIEPAPRFRHFGTRNPAAEALWRWVGGAVPGTPQTL